jgi:hypothetical protein
MTDKLNQIIIRLAFVLGIAAAITVLAGCATSTVVVYHNPLNRGIERNLLSDTTLLNPNAADHPNKIDLSYWYTEDSLLGADTLKFLESFPKSEIDTIYHPSQLVGAAHPIYRLSGAEDGKIEKIFLSDDSTYVIEPMAYIVNGYQLEFMIPFQNEDGFKSGSIHLTWIDSLSRSRIIDHSPEAGQLARYALLGGLMMFLVIGSQNGLF